MWIFYVCHELPDFFSLIIVMFVHQLTPDIIWLKLHNNGVGTASCIQGEFNLYYLSSMGMIYSYC